MSKVIVTSDQLNPLPNDKVLDSSKLKGLADDKIKVIEKSKFILGRVENIVGNGENADYQHFLLFPKCFQRVCESRDCLVKG